MDQLFTIHTDALPGNAQRIASALLWRPIGAFQGGSHGTMITLAPYEDAQEVAAELREYGYTARVDHGVGG